MIKAFRPLRTSFYTLYAAFVVFFFEQSFTLLFPAVLFLLFLTGVESFYRADLDRIYGSKDYSAEDKQNIFRTSMLFAAMGLLSAFYFGLGLKFSALFALGFVGAWLSHKQQFVSDLLLSATTGIFVATMSADLLLLFPVYWFIFFSDLAIRSAKQLSRPFGMAERNLPQLLGVAAAEDFVTVLNGLSAMWPIMMAKYAPGPSFLTFSVSALLLSAAIYAMEVGHVKRSKKLTAYSSLIFLGSLFVQLLFEIF